MSLRESAVRALTKQFINFVKEALKILAKIRDLIFPVFCISCGLEGLVICVKCLEKIRPRPQFFCPVCHKDNLSGEACLLCCQKSFLDGAVSLGEYSEKTLQKALVEYKYNFNKDIFVIFEKLIDDFWWRGKEHLVFDKDLAWIVVPVPLHRRRLWERGFNQAEEIAKCLSQKAVYGLRQDILKRIKETKRQVGLGKEERRKNLIGAFVAGESLSGYNVILIDDVFTTGATLQECAKVLKNAGADLVWALTLARER